MTGTSFLLTAGIVIAAIIVGFVLRGFIEKEFAATKTDVLAWITRIEQALEKDETGLRSDLTQLLIALKAKFKL
jgi:hypothetical protein